MGNTEIGELVVRIKADASPCLEGLAAVEQQVDRIFDKLKKLNDEGAKPIQQPVFSAGLAASVEAEVRRAAPYIAGAARAAVLADMERGAKASRLVGMRDTVCRGEDAEKVSNSEAPSPSSVQTYLATIIRQLRLLSEILIAVNGGSPKEGESKSASDLPSEEATN